jgi:hypothetical protein
VKPSCRPGLPAAPKTNAYTDQATAASTPIEIRVSNATAPRIRSRSAGRSLTVDGGSLASGTDMGLVY